MAKVNKGDTIRLELDMDEGTMRVVVNEADQGVCFTGMQVRCTTPASAPAAPRLTPSWRSCATVSCLTPPCSLWVGSFGHQGYEVWPAIQFYSSGRIVRVLKLEGPRSLEVRELVCPVCLPQWRMGQGVECKERGFQLSSMLSICFVYQGPVVDRSDLCDQIETSVSVGHGMFGKYGDLG